MTPHLRIFYGGTFDPVHNGHLAVARNARDVLSANVHLMPAADPPHKGPTHADAMQRASMLELAVAGEYGLVVDIRELRREGPSYTIDTLHDIRDEFGGDIPVALLLGADSFRGLPSWKSWRELFTHAHFVVAERAGPDVEGYGVEDLLSPELAEWTVQRWAASADALRQASAGLIFKLEQPLRPESASEIRQRIADGEPWHDRVPTAVAEFIIQTGLYIKPAVTPASL